MLHCYYKNNFDLTNPLKGSQEAAQPHRENLRSSQVLQHASVTLKPITL